jgi:hypothetical protein
VPPQRTTQGEASGGMAARSLVGEGPPCAFPSGRCIASVCPTAKRFRRGRARARGADHGRALPELSSHRRKRWAPATQTLFLAASGGVVRATGLVLARRKLPPNRSGRHVKLFPRVDERGRSAPRAPFSDSRGFGERARGVKAPGVRADEVEDGNVSRDIAARVGPHQPSYTWRAGAA